MPTALITHRSFFGHEVSPHHLESPARIEAVWQAMEADRFADLLRVEAPVAELENIRFAHPAEHVDLVLGHMPLEGFFQFDPDTGASAGTREAVMRGVGAVIKAIDLTMTGEAGNAFCAVRPPGHHAEADRVMGFCFFNNVAIGANYARARYGAERVAVVDFDVHHGNGTQAIFWNDPDCFYASSHQFPFYPGTGAANETGQGNIVNAPLPAGAGSEIFRSAYEELILGELDRFSPDFILLSAGFDAHRLDPLGQLNLTEQDFAWVTDRLADIAGRHCSGRMVSVLEGGYNLSALAASVAAHVDRLRDHAS